MPRNYPSKPDSGSYSVIPKPTHADPLFPFFLLKSAAPETKFSPSQPPPPLFHHFDADGIFPTAHRAPPAPADDWKRPAPAPAANCMIESRRGG
jgi:hypothetical protein